MVFWRKTNWLTFFLFFSGQFSKIVWWEKKQIKGRRLREPGERCLGIKFDCSGSNYLRKVVLVGLEIRTFRRFEVIRGVSSKNPQSRQIVWLLSICSFAGRRVRIRMDMLYVFFGMDLSGIVLFVYNFTIWILTIWYWHTVSLGFLLEK